MIVILEVGVLALLASYLCGRSYLRHREAWRQRREDKARERVFREDWQPTVLDTASISPQIEKLRHDYLAAVHSRPRPAGYRSRLIASVRTAMLRLPYFRNLRAANLTSNEHDTQQRAAYLLRQRTRRSRVA
jgi:hypothetical protein